METIQQELEQERQTELMTQMEKPIHINNAEKLEPLMTQMKQWLILSNVLHYIQYDKHLKNLS